MVKKIVIAVLIIWAVSVFYKKYMARTLRPFFRQHAGNVDFMQQKVQDYKAGE